MSRLTPEEIEVIEMKIDNEGGLEGAFINYGLQIKDPHISLRIDQFISAHVALTDALSEAGVEIPT